MKTKISTSHLFREWGRLSDYTKGARIDFHEPDEQGFSAVVHGDHLDNAMGDDPKTNCGEMTIELRRETDAGFRVEFFNLATLIALAREPR
jgi:hypothetical protein